MKMVMRNFSLGYIFNFYSFSLASEIIDTLDLLPLEDDKIIMETKYEFNYENNSLLREDEFYNLGILWTWKWSFNKYKKKSKTYFEENQLFRK